MRDRNLGLPPQRADIPVVERPVPYCGCRCLRQCGRRPLFENDERGEEGLGDAIEGHLAGARALAEFLSRTIDRNRDMQVVRLWITEESLQPDLSRRRVDQIDPAHNFGHTLQVIVDDDGELIGDQPVTAQDHEVARFGLESLRLVALQAVVKSNRFSSRTHADSHLRCIAAIAAVARIDDAHWTAWRGREIASRTAAAVGLFTIDEVTDCRVMSLAARALVDDRSVPLEAVALECRENLRCRTGLFAWGVDILDPDQPESVPGACLEIAGDGSKQGAKVQGAGGRGRETPDVCA